jgi:sugar phosphate permease
VLAPTLRDTYHLSLGETGFLIGGSLVGSTISLVPWGVVTDRFGERLALGVGLGACGIALILAGEAEEFWQLAVLLVAAGCLGASVQSASGRAVMQWFRPARRGFALGVRQTAIPIGGLAASLLIPHLDPLWGFRAMGLFCLVTALVGVIVVREGPVPVLSEGMDALARPFRNRRIWVVSVGSAFLLWPQMCLVGFTVLFLHEDRGVSPGAAAAAVAMVQVIGIPARIAAGWWSDVLGSRLEPLRRVALALVGAVALTAALLHAPLIVLVPVLVLAGGLAMSWNGVAFAAAAEIAGGARAGAAIGLQQTIINTGAAAVTPAFGAIVGASGWTLGFALVAIGPATAFALFRGVPG